jgi:hypothetical protein
VGVVHLLSHSSYADTLHSVTNLLAALLAFVSGGGDVPRSFLTMYSF